MLIIFIHNFGFSQEQIIDIRFDLEDITICGSDADDSFGQNLSLTDINNDGIDDLIISAPFADGPKNERTGCGEVYIIFGCSLNPHITDVTDKANVIFYGRNENHYLGKCITTGDINGDNKQDIIISASHSSGPYNIRLYCGEIYIIYGDNKWENKIFDLRSTQADITIYGATSSGFLTEVKSGDINGDNIDDLIIANMVGDGPDGNKRSCGEVYVIYGKNNFPSNYIIDLLTFEPDLTVYGIDPNDIMGTEIDIGNLNGDNKKDIIIRSALASGPDNNRINCGECYVIYGREDFDSNKIDLSITSPDITIYGVKSHSNLGNITVGDINNDNIDDIIISNSQGDGPNATRINCGESYVIYGRSDFSPNHKIDLNISPWDIIFYGVDEYDYLSRATISDINGDDKNDILIGLPNADGPENNRWLCGEIHVIYNENLGAEIDLKYNKSDIIIYGPSNFSYIGSILKTGDINGDGLKDIVIGSPLTLGKMKTNTGEAYIVYGWRPLDSPFLSIYGKENPIKDIAVKLSLSVGGDPTEMLLSGDITDSFKDTWIPYATSINATLTGSEGTKTVTAKFRNALGRESAQVSDTVMLNIEENIMKVKTNYFNPAKGEKAVVIYDLSQDQDVKINLYGLTGELVCKLANERKPAGRYQLEWDGRNSHGEMVAAGMYLLYLEAGDFKKKEKVLVAK